MGMGDNCVLCEQDGESPVGLIILVFFSTLIGVLILFFGSCGKPVFPWCSSKKRLGCKWRLVGSWGLSGLNPNVKRRLYGPGVCVRVRVSGVP